ncbi:mitogen-activated protein kinase kinase kinase 18-like [Euphorbia lathyris]|uniref:mitogen-activated protein kinase kinase kinase 18-like n=1 Tax=Euphorbia lathyris TaxID=212925 RepID=UPI003313EB07
MDWTRGEIIGRGSTATVCVANFKNSDHTLAVKSAELRQSELLQKEQKLLSNLNFPQIVGYKGHEITEENGKFFYNIFMEYAGGGTLIDEIRRRGGVIEESMIRSYTRDILIGLEYLHCNEIVHCDIKSQNILITDQGAKIADLGCAKKVFDEISERNSIAGTPVYMAPEVARGEYQGFASDLWSLGCTIIEMATGETPWKNVADAVSAIYQIGFSEKVPEIPVFMSSQGKDFLAKCLIKNPNERWSASELLNHVFITEEFPISPNFNLGTPKSVLEQRIWDSELKFDHKTSSETPLKRVLKLAQCVNHESNWGFDGCPISPNFNLGTPKSVLEQRIWDSNHEIELNFDHKTSSSSCSYESPLKRVLKLAQCVSHESNWGFDGSWITVRARARARARDRARDRAIDSPKEVALKGEDLGIWVSGEFDFNYVCNQDLIGGICRINTMISGGCKDVDTLLKVLLVLCVFVRKYLFMSCKFEMGIIKDYFFSIEVVVVWFLLVILGYLKRLNFKLECGMTRFTETIRLIRYACYFLCFGILGI